MLGLGPGGLRFFYLFSFEIYLVLHFLDECELGHCSPLYFKPGDQRFHRDSLQHKEIRAKVC